MGLSSLFNAGRNDAYVSVDIGSNTTKIMQLDISEAKPKLITAALAPTPSNVVSNNAISKPDEVVETLKSLLETNKVSSKKAIIVVPGPCAFTKRVTLAQTSVKELAHNIKFEAANYIPHNIDAVYLDFQVVKSNGKSTMDVLLVAVKKEIVATYLSVVEGAGLEPMILDVDYFALESMWEQNHIDDGDRTVALLNIGARYTSVLIKQSGMILFYGDIGLGGRLYTDALCEALQIKPKEAEQIKAGVVDEKFDVNVINETVERTTDHIAGELQRQLGFFWNASGASKSIEKIYLTGGGIQAAGLLEELQLRTKVSCELVNSFKEINCPATFSANYLKEINSVMSVSVGLAMRRLGDKQHYF
ncbi:MAG: type IV pilus assembly protein PilM [Deltaproteobacteria bacterium]|nr:type IV pilus assembly protein PilM [Deltaproteobacteria bacterium]